MFTDIVEMPTLLPVVPLMSPYTNVMNVDGDSLAAQNCPDMSAMFMVTVFSVCNAITLFLRQDPTS